MKRFRADTWRNALGMGPEEHSQPPVLKLGTGRPTISGSGMPSLRDLELTGSFLWGSCPAVDSAFWVSGVIVGFLVRVLPSFCKQFLLTMAEECQLSWRCLRIGFSPRPATSAAEQREQSSHRGIPVKWHWTGATIHQTRAQAVTLVGWMTWCFTTNSNQTWCDFHREPQRHQCACHLLFELSCKDLFYSSVLVQSSEWLDITKSM